MQPDSPSGGFKLSPVRPVRYIGRTKTDFTQIEGNGIYGWQR
ncbi:hypothetical protein APS_1474 [Acetobacter pasteurianus subsp. pasteurianus LMG 1262 = NBRC 106471]|nr:hypothetical protein APS_1474 [Acetobacter pasteurianus subsp. pasteurianus LMG 1262 = NBRC 106471]